VTYDEFNTVADEHLLGVWGERFYPPAVMSRLFRLVDRLNAEQFVSALQRLMVESQRAPTIAQIYSACSSALVAKRERTRRSRLETAGDCPYCGKSGLVEALLNENPCAVVSFRCPFCASAETLSLSASLLLWSSDLREKYTPVSLKPESYRAARNLQRSVYDGVRICAKSAPPRKKSLGRAASEARRNPAEATGSDRGRNE
jgi:hypothetical protein